MKQRKGTWVKFMKGWIEEDTPCMGNDLLEALSKSKGKKGLTIREFWDSMPRDLQDTLMQEAGLDPEDNEIPIKHSGDATLVDGVKEVLSSTIRISSRLVADGGRVAQAIRELREDLARIYLGHNKTVPVLNYKAFADRLEKMGDHGYCTCSKRDREPCGSYCNYCGDNLAPRYEPYALSLARAVREEGGVSKKKKSS